MLAQAMANCNYVKPASAPKVTKIAPDLDSTTLPNPENANSYENKPTNPETAAPENSASSNYSTVLKDIL